MRLELAGGLLVLRDDGLAVSAAVLVDVGQCLVERRDGDDIHLVVHELRVVQAFVVIVECYLPLHRSQQLGDVGLAVLVDEQRVECIADADTTGLGVADNLLGHLQVAVFVEVCVYHAGSRLDDGDAGGVAHEIDEASASSWNAQVYVAHSVQQFARGLMGCRQQGYYIWVYTMARQHFVNQSYCSLVRQICITATLQHARITTLETK